MISKGLLNYIRTEEIFYHRKSRNGCLQLIDCFIRGTIFWKMEEYDEFDIDVIDVVDSWEVQVVVQRRYEWT